MDARKNQLVQNQFRPEDLTKKPPKICYVPAKDLENLQKFSNFLTRLYDPDVAVNQQQNLYPTPEQSRAMAALPIGPIQYFGYKHMSDYCKKLKKKITQYYQKCKKKINGQKVQKFLDKNDYLKKVKISWHQDSLKNLSGKFHKNQQLDSKKLSHRYELELFWWITTIGFGLLHQRNKLLVSQYKLAKIRFSEWQGKFEFNQNSGDALQINTEWLGNQQVVGRLFFLSIEDKELDLIAFSFSGLFKITPDHFEPTADLEALSLCQKPGTFKFHESIPQIQCTKLQFLINLNNFCQDICSYTKKTCLSINRIIYYAIQAMIGHNLLLYDSKFYATSEMKTRINYEQFQQQLKDIYYGDPQTLNWDLFRNLPGKVQCIENILSVKCQKLKEDIQFNYFKVCPSNIKMKKQQDSQLRVQDFLKKSMVFWESCYTIKPQQKKSNNQEDKYQPLIASPEKRDPFEIVFYLVYRSFQLIRQKNSQLAKLLGNGNFYLQRVQKGQQYLSIQEALPKQRKIQCQVDSDLESLYPIQISSDQPGTLANVEDLTLQLDTYTLYRLIPKVGENYGLFLNVKKKAQQHFTFLHHMQGERKQIYLRMFVYGRLINFIQEFENKKIYGRYRLQRKSFLKAIQNAANKLFQRDQALKQKRKKNKVKSEQQQQFQRMQKKQMAEANKKMNEFWSCNCD